MKATHTVSSGGGTLTRRRRAGLAIVAVSIAGASLYGLGPGGATASSHREAPLVAADPAIDKTDFYLFVSPDRPDYLTMIANWQPLSEPNGGPNSYPFATDARYVINFDNNGDAKPDAIFRWKFRNVDKRSRTGLPGVTMRRILAAAAAVPAATVALVPVPAAPASPTRWGTSRSTSTSGSPCAPAGWTRWSSWTSPRYRRCRVDLLWTAMGQARARRR